jgi:hypothetical protein
LWFARRFDQFGDHMRRRGQIGISHAEVDYVFAAVTRLHLKAVDNVKNVRRKTLDALKFHSPVTLSFPQKTF